MRSHRIRREALYEAGDPRQSPEAGTRALSETDSRSQWQFAAGSAARRCSLPAATGRRGRRSLVSELDSLAEAAKETRCPCSLKRPPSRREFHSTEDRDGRNGFRQAFASRRRLCASAGSSFAGHSAAGRVCRKTSECSRTEPKSAQIRVYLHLAFYAARPENGSN